MELEKIIKKYFPQIIVLTLGLLFGSFLMFSSFSSTPGTLEISSKAWSDFASHIPLIRSFSLGANFPPQYPLFSGEPIKYHFLFYGLVGLLEKIELPAGLALNIPSIFGFVFLSFMIYSLAFLIFKSKTVGVLSVVFLLFNSSASFIYFFDKYPLSLNSINQIVTNSEFLSFAPYGDGIITAFWNLNIYTNQRHLALSFALSLLIIFFLIKPIFNKERVKTKIAAFLGVLLGISFFLHMAVFFMTGVVVLFLGLFFSKIRRSSLLLLIISSLIAFPQYLYLTSSPGYQINLNPGFLISNNLTFYNFLEFWVLNLGIAIILIPLGFIMSNKTQKKILISFFALFLIGNLIQFSPEIAANHKFFNYFLIVANMYSAHVLVKLWNRKHLFKLIVAVLFFLMIFGGIIDFFPLYNDHKLTLKDYGEDKNVAWILENTPPDSVFLNTTFLYNPASLAGRKIFLGWPYFAWSQGYDTTKRGATMTEMLGANDKQKACALLKENNIDYIEIRIQNPPDPDIPPLSNLFSNEFMAAYNLGEDYTIYDVRKNCIFFQK